MNISNDVKNLNKKSGRYNLFSSDEIYKLYKLIYLKKEISFQELMNISKKSKFVLSEQLRPLRETKFINVKQIGRENYYSINESRQGLTTTLYSANEIDRDVIILGSNNFSQLYSILLISNYLNTNSFDINKYIKNMF